LPTLHLRLHGLRLLLHERILLLEVISAVERLVFELIAGALVELFLARVDVGGQRRVYTAGLVVLARLAGDAHACGASTAATALDVFGEQRIHAALLRGLGALLLPGSSHRHELGGLRSAALLARERHIELGGRALRLVRDRDGSREQPRYFAGVFLGPLLRKHASASAEVSRSSAGSRHRIRRARHAVGVLHVGHGDAARSLALRLQALRLRLVLLHRQHDALPVIALDLEKPGARGSVGGHQ
jgi:hypothetical protein